VLKLLPAALRDGDPILAILEASAVNQDGRSNGITAPNGAAQAELIRRTLRLAGRTPADVSYVEAHGTGTSLGDPIEFEGLQAALGVSGPPCALAAVKTNLGHLEAAAGITSLIKTVLQVHHGQVAPHLHLETINPRIALAGSRFHIPCALEPWEGDRVAGVSAFGFGGTNAHVIVAQAPPCPALLPDSRPLHLLPLSAKSASALRTLARRFAEYLRENPTAASVSDVSSPCPSHCKGNFSGDAGPFCRHAHRGPSAEEDRVLSRTLYPRTNGVRFAIGTGLEHNRADNSNLSPGACCAQCATAKLATSEIYRTVLSWPLKTYCGAPFGRKGRCGR